MVLGLAYKAQNVGVSILFSSVSLYTALRLHTQPCSHPFYLTFEFYDSFYWNNGSSSSITAGRQKRHLAGRSDCNKLKLDDSRYTSCSPECEIKLDINTQSDINVTQSSSCHRP